MKASNPWLVAGGWMSLAASVLHIACIFGGPDWYRFFGAGEPIAQAAERGSWVPPLLTLGIASILAIWAAYAFAGAGLIRRLPLMRTALVAISTIYLARGLMVFYLPLMGRSDLSSAFLLWSSLIVLAIGIAYGVGTWRAWPTLSSKGLTA